MPVPAIEEGAAFPPPSSNAQFGSALAIDDDLLIVGAYNDETTDMPLPGGEVNNRGAGSAYIYERTEAGWRQATRLVGDPPIAGEGFGFSVAIKKAPDGGQNLALVGAPYHGPAIFGPAPTADNPYRGAVYLFEQQHDGTWAQLARLTAPAGGPQALADLYGYALAFRGRNEIIVSAIGYGPVLRFQAPSAVYQYNISRSACLGVDGAGACLCTDEASPGECNGLP